jgi:hypothetical protein
MNVWERIKQYFDLRPRGPETLMSLARSRRMPSTSRLYIVETDFAISDDAYDKIQAHLDELRQKYSLDFLLLEPGFKLKRFDDY